MSARYNDDLMKRCSMIPMMQLQTFTIEIICEMQAMTVDIDTIEIFSAVKSQFKLSDKFLKKFRGYFVSKK